MSSLDRRAVILMPLALAACGFTPVYGTGGAGAALRNQVQVQEPGTRDAFLLVQELERQLGRPGAAKYGLLLSLEFESEGLAVTPTGTTTRFNLVGTAEYSLFDLTSQAELAAGRVQNFTGYSTTGSTVETLAAERDARERLAVILANQITARLFALADLPAS